MPNKKLPVTEADLKPKKEYTAASAQKAKKVAKKSVKKTNPQKKGLTRWFFIGLLVVSLAFLFSFYGVMLYALIQGDLNNPLFQILGIEGKELKQWLLSFTNIIFGFLTLLAFLIFLVMGFRLVMSPKNSALKKARMLQVFVWGGVAMVLAFLWLSLYVAIARADADTTQKTTVIATNPLRTANLTAPVVVGFDVAERIPQYGIPMANVRSVRWDFDGDGEIDATGATVRHRFEGKGKDDGQFATRVTIDYINIATGEAEIYTETRDIFIENVALQPVITTSVEEGPAPLEVEFNPFDSIDPDGQILLYEWDLDGDDIFEFESETPELVTRQYDKIGEYNVRLRITGTNGDTETVVKIIKVLKPTLKVEARITSDVPFEGKAPYTLTLDGSQSFSEIGVIKKYEWTIDGEKEVSSSRKIRRTFREPGVYTITLVVENTDGERAKITQEVRIKAEDTEQAIILQSSQKIDLENRVRQTVPFELALDASSSLIVDPVEWQWDFGNDGLIESYEPLATIRYREPGTYLVKLTVLNAADKKFEKLLTITADRVGIEAQISTDQQSGDVPLQVAFDGSGSFADKGEIIDYVWFFPGKEPIHYGAQISHIFRKIGTFEVRLKVVTSNGETAETKTYVSVRAPSLRAEFEPSVSGGAAPLRVTFDPRLSQGVVAEYYWDFGDGTRSRDVQPTHVYQRPGTYQAELRIVNEQGVVSEVRKTITITP